MRGKVGGSCFGREQFSLWCCVPGRWGRATSSSSWCGVTLRDRLPAGSLAYGGTFCKFWQSPKRSPLYRAIPGRVQVHCLSREGFYAPRLQDGWNRKGGEKEQIEQIAPQEQSAGYRKQQNWKSHHCSVPQFYFLQPGSPGWGWSWLSGACVLSGHATNSLVLVQIAASPPVPNQADLERSPRATQPVIAKLHKALHSFFWLVKAFPVHRLYSFLQQAYPRASLSWHRSLGGPSLRRLRAQFDFEP